MTFSLITSWEEVAPLYDELASAQLDAGRMEGWLAAWTALADRVEETYNRLYVATAVDTADLSAEQAYRDFVEVIQPAAQAADYKLKLKLLDSGLEPPSFAVPLRNMQAEADLFREANLPLRSRELALATDYDRVVGAQTVSWRGEELTLPQLLPLMQEPERSLREEAWRAGAARRLADRDALDSIWQELLDIRVRMAENAGHPNYISYRWQQLLRFDYDPEDCRRFHDSIAEMVVPAVERLNERRRVELGLESLRPWDLEVDPAGRPPLRPFATGDELERKVGAVCRQVDPALGEQFEVMRRERLFDLGSRKGKAPGGFMLELPASRRPFVFANTVGSDDDVMTLLHESGHSFHAFETARLPFHQQRVVPIEFSEVASMAMEHLSLPYLDRGDDPIYNAMEAARSRADHAVQSLRFWPYMAVVDAFQLWAYERPEDARRPANCEDRWEELARRFRPGVDWSGLEAELRDGWRQRLHIFADPLYYVEYGLALLGAVQIWANARHDQEAAVAAYRRALALGGTVPLPELFRAAGVEFTFDPPVLQNAVALLEQMAAAS